MLVPLLQWRGSMKHRFERLVISMRIYSSEPGESGWAPLAIIMTVVVVALAVLRCGMDRP